MINVESDDYGVITERRCDCPLGSLGFGRHLHRIRSHEKLTTEGNHFLGSELHGLVDELLPARFGGGPTDYQLVDEEDGALSRLSVVVGSRVGAVAEREVLSAVYAYLRRQPHNRLMAEFWEQSDSVRVVRREPYVTAVGKILPLHVRRP
jgi:hypothetical protein